VKKTLLAFFIAISTVRTASAIKAASEAEKADIQKQMFVANRIDDQVKTAELKVSRAKIANESRSVIIELERKLDREKNEQSAARTIAIHMTILAYGLEPPSPSGTSVMPMTKGRSISWMPVAREKEARQMQDAAGKLQDVKQPKEDLDGAAYVDGTTYIFPSAFEHGPGYLASILLHERTHFLQHTTAGKGNAMSYAEAQQEAYQAQVDNAHFFLKSDDPQEQWLMKEIERLRDEEKAKAALEKKERETPLGRLRGLFPRSNPSDMFESKVHTNAELADISGLVAQARAQADIARRDREEREANERRGEKERDSIQEALHEAEEYLRRSRQQTQEITPARAIPPAPLSSVLPRLREFAITACRAPEQVAVEGYLYAGYDISYREFDDLLARDLTAGLGECPRQLFNQVIATIRTGDFMRIDSEWIRNQVAAYSRSSDASPGYSAPPPERGRRCEDYGNIRCP